MSYEKEKTLPFFESESSRIEDFGNVVKTVVDIKPVPIKLDLTLDDPVELAFTQFKNEHSSLMGPTLFLNEQFMQNNTGPLTFNPLVARGKKSKHGVFFGSLYLDDDKYIEVAVKPHITAVGSLREAGSTHSAIKDYANNQLIRDLDFDGLQTVGFLLDSMHRAYSFTKLDESITTLDSIDWTGFFPDIENNPAMCSMWSLISQQAAQLHSIGSAQHGDLAPRNIAISSSKDSVFFIDWEDARINLSQPRDPEVALSYSLSDLSVLLESMCRPSHDDFKPGIGIFYQKKEDWWSGFKTVFFDEYCSSRLQIASNQNQPSNKLADVKEELVELEKRLRGAMRMHHQICQEIPPKS